MWKQHKLLSIKENSEKTVELWGNETNIPKYDENIADTLTWDENDFNTLKMFQDLTWETWEYYFKPFLTTLCYHSQYRTSYSSQILWVFFTL